jgi:hypothetical protein
MADRFARIFHDSLRENLKKIAYALPKRAAAPHIPKWGYCITEIMLPQNTWRTTTRSEFIGEKTRIQHKEIVQIMNAEERHIAYQTQLA